MHMADALVTPMVGCTMFAAAAGVTAYSVNKIRKEEDNGGCRSVCICSSND